MTAPASPRISVIIGNYNAGEFIGEAIQSALDQTRPADQIVISDVSTDNSREIIQKFSAQFPQRIVTKFGYNKGALSTILAGMQEADGDLVFLLDGDDRYQPGHLEGMEKRWQEFSHADLIYCRHRIFGDSRLAEIFQLRHLHEDSAWLGQIDLGKPYDWGLSTALAWCLEDYHIGGITSCLSFRREHFTALPLAQMLAECGALLHHNADYIILLASALFGGRKVFAPNQTLDYRLHAASNTGSAQDGDKDSRYLQALGCRTARNWLCSRPFFSPHMHSLLDAEMAAVPDIAPGHRDLYLRAKIRPRSTASELQSLQASAASALRKLADIENSTCWRITAPIRSSVDFLRSLRRPASKRLWMPLTMQTGLVAVDITNIWHSDSGTGIQRVVREIATALTCLDTGKKVVLVECSSGIPRNVTAGFVSGEPLPAAPEEITSMETFIMLDSSYNLILQLREQLHDARRKGIRIVSICHDVFPVTYPHLFECATAERFSHWLAEASLFSDAFLCISRHTASELKKYHARQNLGDNAPAVGWWPMGSNFSVSGTLIDKEETGRPEPLDFLLMVGTVEPRKNYDFTLNALEDLWNSGHLHSPLVLVGRPGWKCRHTMARLHALESKGRVFWHGGGLPDRQLRMLYQRAKVVIQASLDEGFGLPVAEAALFSKPVVLSDIPIFREIVMEHGYYFTQGDAASFASALLRAMEPGAAPTRTTGVSWEESASAFWKECTRLLASSDR